MMVSSVLGIYLSSIPWLGAKRNLVGIVVLLDKHRPLAIPCKHRGNDACFSRVY